LEQRQDIVLGAIFMALGIAAAWMATSYQGAGGTYPLVLGLILALFGGVVAAKSIWRSRNRERELIAAPAKMFTAAIVAALYVGLVVPLGFYTTSLLLMVALPIALGFRRFGYALVVAVVFISIVYLVFSVLLEKPLPREAVVQLLNLGR